MENLNLYSVGAYFQKIKTNFILLAESEEEAKEILTNEIYNPYTIGNIVKLDEEKGIIGIGASK